MKLKTKLSPVVMETVAVVVEGVDVVVGVSNVGVSVYKCIKCNKLETY